MAMTSREVLVRTVRFQRADRIPYELAEVYGSDFANVWMKPSPDDRPRAGVDEWGSVWHNIGVSHLGQVKEPALKDWADDWGLQDRLMISPASWREIWKPAYARVYQAAHDAGLLTFLHSCGDITAILDDLIEIGLDVIQMDQQENMGLERLGREFGGRITFWCPVDIQGTMVEGSMADIRAYCRELVSTLGRPEGGFIAKWYRDPAAAGHRQEAIDAMCQEFVRLGGGHATGPALDLLSKH